MKIEKPVTSKEQAKQIGLGYAVVVIFLIIFAIVLIHGHKLHAEIRQPTWAIAIAFILILPIFIPSLIRYLAPRVTGIKIGSILELSLKQMEESSYSVKDLDTRLGRLGMDAQDLVDYENIMTGDARQEIIKHVEKIRDDRYEILIVDLKPENSWMPQNLYFLALLLLRRTEVKQVAFVDTRNKKYEFVGMSSPQEIIETLGTVYSEFQVAANSVCIPAIESKSQPNFPPPPPCGDVTVFFHTLTSEWRQRGIPHSKEVLTSAVISRLMKTKLHEEKVEYKIMFSLEDYRNIVLSENSYIAIVQDNELKMLVNRDKIALKISQELMKSTIK